MLTNFHEIRYRIFFHIYKQNERVPHLNFKSLFFTIILWITLVSVDICYIRNLQTYQSENSSYLFYSTTPLLLLLLTDFHFCAVITYYAKNFCHVWCQWNDKYTFRSAIWTYQFLHTFQIADLKVSIFVQGCQIADVSQCICKQICEGSLAGPSRGWGRG